jgi:hypothetical protein
VLLLLLACARHIPEPPPLAAVPPSPTVDAANLQVC